MLSNYRTVLAPRSFNFRLGIPKKDHHYQRNIVKSREPVFLQTNGVKRITQFRPFTTTNSETNVNSNFQNKQKKKRTPAQARLLNFGAGTLSVATAAGIVMAVYLLVFDLPFN